MILIFFYLALSFCHSLNLGNFRQIKCDNRPRNPKKKIYFIDIDGTICFTERSLYNNSIPDYEKIKIFNNLYDKGHEINYLTARGSISGKIWDDFTVSQLESWNVKYSSINIGKPHYDIWIDDKAINIDDVDEYFDDVDFDDTF